MDATALVRRQIEKRRRAARMRGFIPEIGGALLSFET
jgi:hypothetical protein